MNLVLDSSALITLGKIGQLDLLRQLAEAVFIPPAVYDEVVKHGRGRPGSEEVNRSEWIVRQQVTNREAIDSFQDRLGRGEAEAIVLAQDIQADLLVLDDSVARRVAENRGLVVVGLLGLLLHAKRQGIIQALKPILDRMKEAGFYLDDHLYERLLLQAGESPSS